MKDLGISPKQGTLVGWLVGWASPTIENVHLHVGAFLSPPEENHFLVHSDVSLRVAYHPSG